MLCKLKILRSKIKFPCVHVQTIVRSNLPMRPDFCVHKKFVRSKIMTFIGSLMSCSNLIMADIKILQRGSLSNSSLKQQELLV